MCYVIVLEIFLMLHLYNLYNIDIEPMGAIEYIVTFPDHL